MRHALLVGPVAVLVLLGACTPRSDDPHGEPAGDDRHAHEAARVPPEPVTAEDAMPLEVRQAYKDILGATRFESAAIGYSGSLSPHARAVRRLLQEPGAVRHFDRLWTDGTLVSRLYALAAYWYLAPERYADRLVAMRLEAHVSIDAQRGCIGERLTIGNLLDCDGRVRTRRHPLAPGSSATAAYCARRRNGNFCDDFSSGAAAIAIVEGTTIAEPRCSANPSTWPRVVVSADGRLCSRNYPVDLQVFASCESTVP